MKTGQDLDEAISEHQHLVKVLRSTSHDDDRREAKKQAAELKTLRRQKVRDGLPAKSAPEAYPGVEPGDSLYIHHPKRGPLAVKVHAQGRHGITATDSEGNWHRAKWQHVLGAKQRLSQRLTLVDQGEDGAITEDETGQRRYVAIDPEARPDPQPLRKSQPTAAQIEAGNYRKEHLRFQGLDISIENPKGSVRTGTGPGGKTWRVTMRHAYGYIRGTCGVDKDHVDCYLGPNPDASHAYIVHQRQAGKWDRYDEDKVMLGFDSAADAKAAYLAQYDDPRFFGTLTAMPMADFKRKALATRNRPQMIKGLILFLKAQQHALFDTPITVPGYTRTSTGKFVQPFASRRKKRMESSDLFGAAQQQHPVRTQVSTRPELTLQPSPKPEPQAARSGDLLAEKPAAPKPEAVDYRRQVVMRQINQGGGWYWQTGLQIGDEVIGVNGFNQTYTLPINETWQDAKPDYVESMIEFSRKDKRRASKNYHIGNDFDRLLKNPEALIEQARRDQEEYRRFKQEIQDEQERNSQKARELDAQRGGTPEQIRANPEQYGFHRDPPPEYLVVEDAWGERYAILNSNWGPMQGLEALPWPATDEGYALATPDVWKPVSPAPDPAQVKAAVDQYKSKSKQAYDDYERENAPAPLTKSDRNPTMFHACPLPEQAVVLFFKAIGVTIKNRPGLALQTITDKKGHTTQRWERTQQKAKADKKPKAAQPDQSMARTAAKPEAASTKPEAAARSKPEASTKPEAAGGKPQVLFADQDVQHLPPKAKQPFKTQEELYAHSEKALTDLKVWLDEGNGVCDKMGHETMRVSPDDADMNKPGGMLFIAKLKGAERAAEKVANDYEGDWSLLKDTVRCSIAVDNFEQLHDTLETLKKSGLKLAQQPKDRFKNPTEEGYCDVLMNVELPNGIIGELQLHLKSMLVAKAEAHHYYEITRTIKGKPEEQWSDDERQRFEAAFQKQKEIYANAWQSTFNKAYNMASAMEKRAMSKYAFYERDDALFRRNEAVSKYGVDDVWGEKQGKWSPYQGDKMKPVVFGNRLTEEEASRRLRSR